MRRTDYPLLFTAALVASSLVLAPAAEAVSIQSGIGMAFSTHPDTLLAGYGGFRVRVRSSRYRAGGFRRGGDCLMNQNDRILVIAPPVKPEEEAAFSENLESGDTKDNIGPIDRTASAYPVVLAYIPQLTGPTEAQLTVQTGDFSTQLADISFNLSGQAGIVAIQMPRSMPALEIETPYVWQLAVQCDTADDSRSDDLVVESWIEREALDTAATGTLQEQAAFYAAEGIWQETASTLAQLRYQFPGDASIGRDWAALMNDVGLAEFAATPVVQAVGL
ncbi:MAG: DUF928 domain-containing protein [Leptolyngbyaceae cyanobacterium SM1_1_3]|nr:DUF928 domain-containing protein [Leptolyngbyaceae cyanobacterium SM1_1_3]NJN02256.1 DUF928 domain-containing protein [Leptolyngbyaceae cyanobacterium RM1_1_2]NJO08462.1 DUF928 domain-containing protein [Leptolyngbyaceae cyanobacterium SL_1_1]